LAAAGVLLRTPKLLAAARARMDTHSSTMSQTRTGARDSKHLFPIPENLSGVMPRAPGERDVRIITRTRQTPERRKDQQDWPAHKKAHGEFMLKASPDAESHVRAVCSVLHGVLTLTDIKRSAKQKCLAQVPLHDLAVGLQRGRTSMLTIATVYGGEMFDEIYCFADDPVKRNRWIATFRRMGVPIFDLSVDGHAEERCHEDL